MAPRSLYVGSVRWRHRREAPVVLHLSTTLSVTMATACTVTARHPDDEGLTHAGDRYLISDRDLDALGLALMAWEDHLALSSDRAETTGKAA